MISPLLLVVNPFPCCLYPAKKAKSKTSQGRQPSGSAAAAIETVPGDDYLSSYIGAGPLEGLIEEFGDLEGAVAAVVAAEEEATSPARPQGAFRPSRAQLAPATDALGELQPSLGGNAPGNRLYGHEIQVETAAAVDNVGGKDATAAHPAAVEPVAEAAGLQRAANISAAALSIAAANTTGVTNVAASEPDLNRAARVEKPAAVVPGSSAPVQSRAGRISKPSSKAVASADAEIQEPATKRPRTDAAGPKKEKLTTEENEQLKIFVEEAHKEMFKTSKNAQGYTALARSKMFDFYTGLENLPRIQRVLKSEQAISNRVKNLLGKDGIASFAHVKEAGEAAQKKSDELAAKIQGQTGLGIGAPALDMTAENIFAWIEKFKSEHVEIRSGKVSKFKSAITKEVVKELIDRVRLWISVHDAKSSVQRWKQFETDLRMAYNGTFI